MQAETDQVMKNGDGTSDELDIETRKYDISYNNNLILDKSDKCFLSDSRD